MTTTDATCAEACWNAREAECRCACGGANHGRLLTEDGEQPRRSCRIQGHRYVLGAIGFVPGIQAWAAGRADTARFLSEDARATGVNGPGSIVWQRVATVAQSERWSELAFWRDAGRSHNRPQLAWVREDYADAFDAAFGGRTKP